MEWRELSYFPGLEMNRQGEVRKKDTHEAVTPRAHPSGGYNDIIMYQRKTSQVNVLLEETFGPGAAEAANLPKPDWNRVARSRALAEARRQGTHEPAPQGKGDAPLFGKRRCTDCGKPTYNYRCEKCWKKKRGFGFESSDDEGLVTAEARQRMLFNDAAAKSEKKDARGTGKDWFVPSTRFGTSPPPPPPGEQERLTPAMPAKGHAGQWPHPQPICFMPKKRKKEKAMQIYTTADLADMVGVKVKDIQNARYSKTAKPFPGSAVFKVREFMERHGITWDQVGSGSKDRPAGEMRLRPTVEDAPTPEDVTVDALSLPETVDPDPDLVVELHEAPYPDRDAGEDSLSKIEAELAAEERERDWIPACAGMTDEGAGMTGTDGEGEKAEPDRGTTSVIGSMRDYSLAHVPMEFLVMEITRRVPRAEVVLR